MRTASSWHDIAINTWETQYNGAKVARLGLTHAIAVLPKFSDFSAGSGALTSIGQKNCILDLGDVVSISKPA